MPSERQHRIHLQPGQRNPRDGGQEGIDPRWRRVDHLLRNQTNPHRSLLPIRLQVLLRSVPGTEKGGNGLHLVIFLSNKQQPKKKRRKKKGSSVFKGGLTRIFANFSKQRHGNNKKLCSENIFDLVAFTRAGVQQQGLLHVRASLSRHKGHQGKVGFTRLI